MWVCGYILYYSGCSCLLEQCGDVVSFGLRGVEMVLMNGVACQLSRQRDGKRRLGHACTPYIHIQR